MDTSKITRLEIINHHTNDEKEFGRAYTYRADKSLKVQLEIQDDGRTLKVFLSRKD